MALPNILAPLEAPPDGRLLAFGASTSDYALALASERPDLLIILCDTTAEVIRSVSDRAVAERLDNFVVGDTHAGPPVDRALCVNAMAAMAPQDFRAVRNALRPDGYALFIEAGESSASAIEQLKAVGYTAVDELPSRVSGYFVLRAH